MKDRGGGITHPPALLRGERRGGRVPHKWGGGSPFPLGAGKPPFTKIRGASWRPPYPFPRGPPSPYMGTGGGLGCGEPYRAKAPSVFIFILFGYNPPAENKIKIKRATHPRTPAGGEEGGIRGWEVRYEPLSIHRRMPSTKSVASHLHQPACPLTPSTDSLAFILHWRARAPFPLFTPPPSPLSPPHTLCSGGRGGKRGVPFFSLALKGTPPH